MTCPTCGMTVRGGTHVRDCGQTDWCWCDAPVLNNRGMCLNCLRAHKPTAMARLVELGRRSE